MKDTSRESGISADAAANGSAVPPRQHNYEDAAQLALEVVRNQSAEQLEWLGARREGDVWLLNVLGSVLEIDLKAGRIFLPLAGGAEVGRSWRVLVLHYLSIADRGTLGPPEITFADMPGGLVYASVYQNRVIGRLCGTAGRDRQQLDKAVELTKGLLRDGGDATFDFDVFPRISIRLIWHGPDDEFPASATILLPGGIETFLSVEDVVVLSECFVSRLSGRDF